MSMQRSLASVAQFELNALVEETKGAINALRRQRDSVVQAIERAQQANGRSAHLPDETVELIARLVDKLHRLDSALDGVICEIEQTEATPISPIADPFIVFPFPLTQVPTDEPSLVEIQARH